MIVSVIAVTVVQAPIMDIIHVAAVLHHFMLLAIVAVGVIVAGNAHHQFFSRRIGCGHFQRVFIDMAIMPVVEMPVMQVINMPAVIDRGVAAGSAVGVGFMACMNHFVGGERACQKRCSSKGNEESCHGRGPFDSNDPANPLACRGACVS